MSASPTKVNGTQRQAVPVIDGWRSFPLSTGNGAAWERQPNPEPTAAREAPASPAEPTPDPVAEAKAEAIRAEAWAKAEADRQQAAADAEERRIKAEAEAKATEIKAAEEAERLRIANERARMKLEKDQVDHAAYKAKKEAEEARDKAAAEKAEKAAEDEAQAEADRVKEQQRSEALWKWGARGIYAVCLVLAAPVQFLDFWDAKRPFLVAAPAMLEGIALVLACGAAWAVAHRRDVLPYRLGIVLGAAVAATINLRGGLTNPAIGFNAGLVGAIASLIGPIVLMVYEHGITQKVDGIPSWRERRAVERAEKAAAEAKALAKAEKESAAEKAADEKAAQQKHADEEQKRKDEDRRQGHPDVWEVADSIRSARGSKSVTDAIWSEAWYLVTGSKHVGITPEIEALSREAQERMKAAKEIAPGDALSQVGSQKEPRVKRDPDALDGRRFNGGTPPRRVPGDTAPYSPIAKKQASLEQVAASANTTSD